MEEAKKVEEVKKEEKKPRISVFVPNEGIQSTIKYLSSGMLNFALASLKDGKRVQATQFFSCRDYISDSMRAFFAGLKNFSYYGNDYPDLDGSTLRLLIATGGKDTKKAELKNIAARLYFAKRIINTYEILGGFERRSLLTRIDLIDKDKKTCPFPTWLLTGPGEWMHASQLTSMVTLILRAVWRTGFRLDSKIDTIEDVNNYLDNLRKSQSNLGEDATYTSHFKRWEILIRNFKAILGDLDQETRFPANFPNSWHSSGGIYYATCFKTYIKPFDERFEALCKEAGV